MANFQYATLSDAQSALAARLYDPTNQFWPLAELQVYIAEALRTWNALTSFWRAEFTFDLQQGVNWYDIRSQANSLRPLTVTDQYLTNLIEYHLLEPLTTLSPSVPSPATWAGSAQFSLSDIYGALTRRQNDVLGVTGCTISRSTINAPFARTGIILPDTTIDIRRVAWLPVAGAGYDTQILRQTDAWAKRAFDNSYLAASQQPPQAWMQNTEPPPRFDVDYIPPVPGNYEVLSVLSGATSTATSAQLLSVPDDWAWVVKWGALSDLLDRESNAKDSTRAAYCTQRFVQGMQLLGAASSVLSLQLNGGPVTIGAVKNADNFRSSWESLTQGTPDSAYSAGLNLLGFPTPDNGGYGCLLSVVENAPVPSISTDYIQVARSDYDVILDYAQHLAAFKQGGMEFTRTMPLLQKFMAQAALYNLKLKVMGQFKPEEYGLAQRESRRNPRVANG